MTATDATTVTPVLDRNRLALADGADMDVSWHEVAGTGVLVIDGLWRDPSYVRALALSLDFHAQRGNHPGLFALVSIHHRPLISLISRWFEDRNGVALDYQKYCRDMTFSLVTRSADELSTFQRQPHHDSICDAAGVVYLNPPERCAGGTSFWRHRSSGLERAPRDDDADMPAFKERLGVETAAEVVNWCLAEGLYDLPAGYLTASNSVWEMTTMIEMRWNRLVLYDARLFHSPHYDEAWFGTHPTHRRLTQNLYLTVSGDARNRG